MALDRGNIIKESTTPSITRKINFLTLGFGRGRGAGRLRMCSYNTGIAVSEAERGYQMRSSVALRYRAC